MRTGICIGPTRTNKIAPNREVVRLGDIALDTADVVRAIIIILIIKLYFRHIYGP